jgi:RHS repeat-associated protein
VQDFARPSVPLIASVIAAPYHSQPGGDMSKTSGTAAEILNLPSGGGSVSGSGTSFSVDLNTGTLVAGVDLHLPAGPNGILPNLALSYSSAAGDGPFGIGWSLGTLTITRRISPSADPQDPTSPGTYTMSGAGDLVDMGGGRYRPAVDTTGMLIEFAGGSWTVTDNRDTSFTLGSTAAARLGADPPAAWLLDSCRDSCGNAVRYTWLPDPGPVAGPGSVAGPGALLPGTVSWGTYQLVFQYESRPDLLSTGAFGAGVQTTQRCRAIELHVTTETASLVRSWQLLYDDDQGAGRSFLATVRELGHAADGSTLAAPDRTYAYTTAGPVRLVPVTGAVPPLSSADTDLVDLDGDGLPDVLTLGPGLPTWSENLGDGTFGFPRPLSRAPSPLRLSAASIAFADMSGEGNADLLVLDQPFAGYYPLSAANGAAPTGFALPVVFRQAPGVLPGDPRVRLLDLNGDHLTDILHETSTGWTEYLREDDRTWSAAPRLLPPERTPPVSLADPHVYLGDMTGDGYTDVVLARGGGVTYWPARADGGWGAAVTMSPGPAMGRGWDPRRLAVVDVDGSGCADLVYVGPGSVTIWRNTGASRLSEPVTIEPTPPAAPGSYRFADLLGLGSTGIVFEIPRTRGRQPRQAFLDLCGGVKPGLLCDIGNGPGQRTRVSYQPSTAFARRDADSGSPWPTYHPFPVQCVAQVDQADLGTGVTATSTYDYHEGRYDPGTRVFLGFARVGANQAGDATCPTLRTETVFHLGLDPGDPARPLGPEEAFELGALRRKVLSTTVWGLDGSDLEPRPYSVATHAYAASVIASALGTGDQVAVPYCTATTEERWERQPAMLSRRVIQYLDVDQEGNVTRQRTTATRTGMTVADQDIITTVTFATGGRNLRLPARATQSLADGTVIGANVTYYDGDAYLGLPEGQAALGLETRVEELAFDDAFVARTWGAAPPDLTAVGYHRLPGDDANWWITRRSQQRGATPGGPLLSTRGSLGAVQSVQLDPAGQRAVQVTDAAGNTLTATIDPRVWQTSSVTDQNQLTATDTFDALGRVTAAIQPGATAALPSAAFGYLAGPISTVTAAARIAHGEPGVLTTITFLDGAGNVLGKAAPSVSGGQWVITNAVTRNPRGLVTAAWAPYEITGPGWQPPPAGTTATGYVFDALGRVVRKTRSDGLTVSIRRDGDTLIFSEQWPGAGASDVERQTFDAAGQLISVSRNAGGQWVQQSYGYDPSGRASRITLPEGTQVTLGYDLLGRRFSHQSPDCGRSVYLLDACGSERQRTLATGQAVRTGVDALNRVTGIFYDDDSAPRVSYAYYDEGGTAPGDGITANRAARLWQIADELGTVTLQYEDSGRVTSAERTVAATGTTYTEQYAYDALGRTISTTLPPTTSGPGRTVQYSYGADGRLAGASGVVEGVSYDLFGRPATLRYANGTQTMIDYRPGGGTAARVRVLGPAGDVLRDVSTSVTDSVITGVSSATGDDDAVTFGYDPLRRLTSAAYRQGTSPPDTRSWAYDSAFNLITSSDAGPLSYTPGTHQLASVAGTAVTFDAAGRMSAGRAGTMEFDAADHLTRVTMPGGVTVTHTYGHDGRLALTAVAGAQSYLAPTDNFVIRGGHQVAWIGFGAMRVAADSDGALWFLHPGALGHLDLVTDAAGAVAARVRLTPYGVARPGAGAPLPVAPQPVAPRPGGPGAAGAAVTLASLLSGTDATGLVCLGQRWYDPLTGQFISPDPIVSGIYTVGAWNPYLYCLGNPVALSDPTGTSFLSVLEVVGIAVLAAACVAAAIWTGGASLVALGLLTSNLSTGMLVGVAVGALGGAVAGELAAQKAGGSVWAGAFAGAILGGMTSLAGGVLGSALSAGVTGGLPLAQYVATGTLQGAIAGAGTGLAVGYAGGKGSAEQMLQAAVSGMAWGASLGFLLSLGTGVMLSATVPKGQTPYLQIGNLANKYLPDPLVQGGAFGAASAADNDLGLGNDIGQLALHPSLGTAGGLGPDFVGVANLPSTQAVGPWFTNGSVLNVSLTGVQSAVLNGGAFAAVVPVSFAADQWGYSYADQVALLLKGAPFVDYAVAIFQQANYGNSSTDADDAFNRAFGSANPNESG